MKPIQILLFFIALFPTLLFAHTLDFLVITDIHLNVDHHHLMQIDPKKFVFQNDLDKKTFFKLTDLIKNNIGQNKLIKKPDFVLYLGDSVGHSKLSGKKRIGYVKKNEHVVYKRLLKMFPKTPIISITGNNDSPQSDYGVYFYHGDSPAKNAVAAGFKNGFLSTGIICKKSKKTFPCLLSENKHHGFFSIQLAPHLVLIGLNSVIFSSHYPKNHSDSQKQFDFLKSTLKKADQNHQSVFIAMHVPFGWNTYNGDLFWKKSAENQFGKIILTYRKIINGILVAHTHMDEMAVIRFSDHYLGEFYTAALSTQHGNSPSVRQYQLIEKGHRWTIKNYETMQIHTVKHKLAITQFYDFQDHYCRLPVDNINLCLRNVTVDTMLPLYTVGNPNYRLARVSAAQRFLITLPANQKQT